MGPIRQMQSSQLARVLTSASRSNGHSYSKSRQLPQMKRPVPTHSRQPARKSSLTCQMRTQASVVTSVPARDVKEAFDLTNGVYIVSGGGRGLGLTMAEALAEAGGEGNAYV